jgi:hypothetical protein
MNVNRSPAYTDYFQNDKEGIMGRIRVNTDDLKAKVKDFESAANAFNTAGDDILATAMSMPSYEGQLSGPARAAGYEIQRQSREVQTLLSGDAQSLQKTAQDFENVNNQTVDIIGENTALLSDSPIYGGPGGEGDAPIKQGGNPDLLAYYDYGDSVIFCKNGECLTVTITDKNRAMIEQYEKSVDDYCKALADMVSIIRDLCKGTFDSVTIACVLVILALSGVILWEFVGALAWAFNISAATVAEAKTAVDTAMAVLGIARAATGTDVSDILKHMGLDPIDPWKFDEAIKKITQDEEIYTKAYNDATNIYNALAPTPTPTPTPSGPTLVPVPTPPTPTPTQTPSAP